jgi:hypothetical protein
MLKNVQKRIHRIVIMHGIDDKKYIFDQPAGLHVAPLGQRMRGCAGLLQTYCPLPLTCRMRDRH